MKSPQVYSLLRDQLGPTLKELGFKREKPMLSWSRHHADLYTVIWCQVSQDGFDPYAGSRFTVELQRSKEPILGMKATARERFARLLTPETREEVRFIQNQVIASLSKPTVLPSHITAETSAWYLKKFDAQATPYTSQCDIWLRYAQPPHVDRWGALLAKLAPGMIQAIESTGSNRA